MKVKQKLKNTKRENKNTNYDRLPTLIVKIVFNGPILGRKQFFFYSTCHMSICFSLI